MHYLTCSILGEFFENVKDSTIISGSWAIALFLTTVRFFGDYYTNSNGSGVMMQFLTGQIVKS